MKWELRCGHQDRKWLFWVESWVGVPSLLHGPHPHPQAVMENMYAGGQMVLPSWWPGGYKAWWADGTSKALELFSIQVREWSPVPGCWPTVPAFLRGTLQRGSMANHTLTALTVYTHSQHLWTHWVWQGQARRQGCPEACRGQPWACTRLSGLPLTLGSEGWPCTLSSRLKQPRRTSGAFPQPVLISDQAGGSCHQASQSVTSGAMLIDGVAAEPCGWDSIPTSSGNSSQMSAKPSTAVVTVAFGELWSHWHGGCERPHPSLTEPVWKAFRGSDWAVC